jgi:hypothetical protein
MAVGFEGVPLLQRSAVHTLPSTGLSVSSETVFSLPPLPSQTIFLQSPAACEETGVPSGVKVKPHTPCAQDRFWHSVSIPGHSSGAVQPPPLLLLLAALLLLLAELLALLWELLLMPLVVVVVVVSAPPLPPDPVVSSSPAQPIAKAPAPVVIVSSPNQIFRMSPLRSSEEVARARARARAAAEKCHARGKVHAS